MNKKNILIAEDSVFNQMFIEEFVKLLDQEYTFVNNGQEVLDILEMEKFDLILMDIEMPIMDGIKATKIIRNSLPYPISQIPIVALTAYKEIYSRDELLDIGINDFILKPFTFDKFNKVVKRFLSMSDELRVADGSIKPFKPATLYDLSYINDFCGKDSEFIKELVVHFVTNTPLIIKKIKSYFNNNEWELLKLEVHKFKPTFLFLGIERLNVELEEIETFANDNHSNFINVSIMIDKIEVECNQIIEALKLDFDLN